MKYELDKTIPLYTAADLMYHGGLWTRGSRFDSCRFYSPPMSGKGGEG